MSPKKKKAKRQRNKSKTLHDFKWAQTAEEKGTGFHLATCTECVKQTLFPPGQRPRSFLKSKPQRSLKKGKYFDFRNFENHEASQAHMWAKKKNEKKSPSILKLFAKQTEVDKQMQSDHRDFAYWLASEGLPALKVVSFDSFQKARGKPFKAHRSEVALHFDSLGSVFTAEQNEIMKNAKALSLSIDDGSNDHSVREYMSIVIKADTMNSTQGEKPEIFLYALKKLEHNQITANGLFAKIETLPIPFEKVFYFVRDGASVMKKASTVFRERKNPYTFDHWCFNHKGNLVLKGVIHGIPEFCEDIAALQAAYVIYKYSPKFASLYRTQLGEQYKGKYALQRVENLTRWVALLVATAVILAVYAKFLAAIIKYKRQHKGSGEDGRLQRNRLQKVIRRFCDYRFIVRLLILNHVGKCFKRFHTALESREADFTAQPEQVRLLRGRLLTLVSEEKVKEYQEECEKIVSQCSKIKHIRKEQKNADVEVRLSDYNAENARDVARDTSKEVIEMFEEEADLRFPLQESKVKSAFKIFDPENFPDISDLSDSSADSEIEKYGNNEILALGNWYGKTHDGYGVEPPVDQAELPEAWGAVKEWWRFRTDTITSFPRLLKKLYKKCHTSSSFYSETKDVISLAQIAEAQLHSTSENERVFRALGEIATPQRVALGDERLEALVKVHTETNRKWQNPANLLTYSDRAKPYFEKLQKEAREKERKNLEERKQRKRTRNNVEEPADVEDEDNSMVDDSSGSEDNSGKSSSQESEVSDDQVKNCFLANELTLLVLLQLTT